MKSYELILRGLSSKLTKIFSYCKHIPSLNVHMVIDRKCLANLKQSWGSNIHIQSLKMINADSSENTNYLVPHCKSLQSLTIVDSSKYCILPILRATSQLTKLSTNIIDNILIPEIAKHTNLTDLSLLYGRKSTSQFRTIIKGMSRLERLRLYQRQSELIEEMYVIGKYCTQLKYIDLDLCRGCTDETLKILVEKCISIQHINASYTWVTSLKCLKNCKNLKYLDLRGTDIQLGVLANVPKTCKCVIYDPFTVCKHCGYPIAFRTKCTLCRKLVDKQRLDSFEEYATKTLQSQFPKFTKNIKLKDPNVKIYVKGETCWMEVEQNNNFLRCSLDIYKFRSLWILV